jgi:Icc-related predicted phosphoesterase
MRLLLFSDLHCDEAAANDIVLDSARVDAVIGAGDYSNIHRGLETMIAILSRIERPCILVAGNNETTDELRLACRKHANLHVLHGETHEIDGVKFFGIGGGIPVTPFGDWSYDFSEEEAERLLEHCPENCVLVSHSPPKGALDVSSSGKSLGSTAVRKAIDTNHPSLVVCGHIHESGGREVRLNNTVVVNAGPRFRRICLLSQSMMGESRLHWEPR